MPYVARERIDCPCGENVFVDWTVIDGVNVPVILCHECGYTKIEMSDLINHEILLPNILKEVALTLGLRLTACEQRWEGLWWIGTLNSVDFYFVSDNSDTAFLKIARAFTGRTKAFFFTGDDYSAGKLADLVFGYPCASIEMVIDFDSDYSIIVDEEHWKPILDEYAPAIKDRTRPPYAFLDIGEHWEITFAGKTKSFVKKRGFEFIRYLLEHPNETFFLPELVSLVDKTAPDAVPKTTNEGEMSDFATITKVRMKKKELLHEKNDALAKGDNDTVKRLSITIDQCDDYLRRVVGRRGEIRKFDGDLEHLRTSVRNAVSRVFQIIEESLPECAAHLRKSIKLQLQTGYTPSTKIDWDL